MIQIDNENTSSQNSNIFNLLEFHYWFISAKRLVTMLTNIFKRLKAPKSGLNSITNTIFALVKGVLYLTINYKYTVFIFFLNSFTTSIKKERMIFKRSQKMYKSHEKV